MDPALCKVLLVDDDPAMLRLLSIWLTKAGYPVQVASNGAQGLAVLENDCPNILITDWEMPVMSGLELCRRVRQLHLSHYVYILFLTANSSPERLIEGLEVGADEFVQKPVSQGELLARVRAGRRMLTLEEQLRLMARTDPLTGLLTRRAFYETMEREWHRAQRLHLPLSCVMLDIDFFKRINDLHGHQAGDAVLKIIANRLTELVRGSDAFCRYGGEEFCAMLPETTEAGAARWAERARQAIVSLAIPVGESDLHVTASLGVAQRYDDTPTVERLIDRADQALLCAKQSGRDRVVCYQVLSDSDEPLLRESRSHEAMFRGIVARDVMTPLVACLHQGETVGNAADFFLRSRITSTPVVDDEGKLQGILSEKDLLSTMLVLDCWSSPVREMMKPNVIWYEEETPIRTIYEFLGRVSIRRVVIVHNGRPTGTISRSTLLRWFRNLVRSKGLLERGTAAAVETEQDADRSQKRLTETARELAVSALNLATRIEEEPDDLVPCIVGGASGIQELVNDLLAFSRYANRSRVSPAAIQAMLLEGNHPD